MAITFELDADYRYVMGAMVLLVVQTVMVGFLTVGGKRKEIFKPVIEEIKEKIKEENKDLDPKKFSQRGYPDMGNGRYSEYLSYKDWVDFNKAQRAHANCLEHVFSFIFLTFVSGLLYPVPSACLCLAYTIARIFYVLGYSKTPKARMPGFIIATISTFTQLILAITGCVYLVL